MWPIFSYQFFFVLLTSLSAKTDNYFHMKTRRKRWRNDFNISILLPPVSCGETLNFMSLSFLQLPLPFLKVGFLTAPPAGNPIAPHGDWKRTEFFLNHEALQQVEIVIFILLATLRMPTS